MTSRGTWKNFERAIAEAWSKAIGLTCKRNPLSGANNVDDRGDKRPGDIIINKDFESGVLLELKYRQSFLHHRLFREAQKDALKHGILNVLLYTKQKNENGSLVIMSADFFHGMLRDPEVQKYFKR